MRFKIKDIWNQTDLYISLLFLPLLLIGIIILYLGYLNQLEFTIYKTECHNETFINEKLCKRIIKECPNDTDVDAFCFNVVCPVCYGKPCKLYINKEVCEQKEVNTLELSKYGIIQLRTTDKDSLTTQLNKGWLYENAECISYCNKRHGQVQCPADEETRIRGNYECSKWELNNYVIEVNEK